jgi:hypothetical protein
MENTKVVIDNKGVGEVQLFENNIKAGKMDIEYLLSSKAGGLRKYWNPHWQN